MRRIQELLSNDGELNATDKDQSLLAIALKNKRMTFAWLDGESQQVSFVILFNMPFVLH